MRSNFNERAIEMGLTVEENGLYSYTDKYSTVIYHQVTTKYQVQKVHETDGIDLPILALFIKPSEREDYLYCGIVSTSYQFIGNDVLNERIRASIKEVGVPILTENTIFNYDATCMRNEIVIQSTKSIAQAGDILPVMIVQNSYNGTKSARISFGIAIYRTNMKFVFRFSFGEIKQVHIVNSRTEITSNITTYMEVFSENIVDLVQTSFNSKLTEDQMFETLDVIEELGKNRKKQIVSNLNEMVSDSEKEKPSLPTAWQMFLAIVRYSSFETNLNIKRLLENTAERVLVIPEKMYKVLKKLH